MSMLLYELKTNRKDYRGQLRAFIDDTGWTGIFKVNVHKKSEPHAIVGEDCLGVTKRGQLVRILFDGEKLRIYT